MGDTENPNYLNNGYDRAKLGEHGTQGQLLYIYGVTLTL